MPDVDLLISEVLLMISSVTGLIVWGISKKWFLALIVFSVMGNLSIIVNADSRMFDAYGIVWLKYFSLIIWPIINVVLIIKYRKEKNASKNN